MMKHGIRAILPILAAAVFGCGQPLAATTSAQAPAAAIDKSGSPGGAQAGAGYGLLSTHDRGDRFGARRDRGDRGGDRHDRRGDRRDDRRGDRIGDRRGDWRGDRRGDRHDRRGDRRHGRHDRHGRWGSSRWRSPWWGANNWWGGYGYAPWWGLGAMPPWLATTDLIADRMIRLGAYYYPFYVHGGMFYPDYARPYIWSMGGFYPATSVTQTMPPPPNNAGPVSPGQVTIVSAREGMVYE